MSVDEKFEHIDLEADKSNGSFPNVDPPPYKAPDKEANNNALAKPADVELDFDEEEFEDETIIERIIALKEMFPESFRNRVDCMKKIVFNFAQGTYSMSRTVSWIAASTSAICFLPLLLELERVQLEEQEAVQQRTMMLGPQAAGGSNLAGFSATIPNLMSK